MKKTLSVGAFLLILIAVWFGARSSFVHDLWANFTNPDLPPVENINYGGFGNANSTSNRNTNTTNANTSVTPIAVEKNLAVPFTSQAPSANWDQDHEEFCEEATVVMVGRFFDNRGFTSTADAEAALQQVKKWQVDTLGFYYDTTAEETARAIESIYDLTVTLKKNPTIDDIRRALSDNKLVIVPTAGRELGNPNFKAPGPIYHNLVIRGYTKDGKFITNDPGTRKGNAYVYSQSVIMNAMHDWVPSGDRTIPANGDATGDKVILIVSR